MAFIKLDKKLQKVDPYRFFGRGSDEEQTRREENKQVIIGRR
jgi:hypothetical protein